MVLGYFPFSLVLYRPLRGIRRVPLAFKGSNLASGTPFLAKDYKILIHNFEVSKKKPIVSTRRGFKTLHLSFARTYTKRLD
jgi:hypothetical protein